MTTIRSIGCALPDLELTNEGLDRANPAWRMELVAELSGVQSRRVAAADETAFDLSVRACESLFESSGIEVGDVDAILYCTHLPDHRMPGNAHLLHAHLGFDDKVIAFDYQLACSGFVYGLAVADAFARTAIAGRMLLVTAETASKHMNRRDRSVWALFGDGAAVTYLTADDDEPGGRIVAYELCTHGRGFEHGYIPAGGARLPSNEITKREAIDQSGNVRTDEDFHMEGTALWAFVNTAIPPHIESFLDKHALTLDEIDLFVFHQASKLILNSLTKSLSLEPEKVFVHMEDIGNLSSASIPFALQAALEQGAIQPGDRVLLSGFGIGISYASAIVQF